MVAIATDQQRTGQISAEERELRIQLAAAYRLADKYISLGRRVGPR